MDARPAPSRHVVSPLEEARVARECIEAALPWWWRWRHRTQFMREVDAYAVWYAAWQGDEEVGDG